MALADSWVSVWTLVAVMVVVPPPVRVMAPVLMSMVATISSELAQVKVAVLLLAAVGRLAAGVLPKSTAIMSWAKLTVSSRRATLNVSTRTALMPSAVLARMRRMVSPAVVGVPKMKQLFSVTSAVRIRPLLRGRISAPASLTSTQPNSGMRASALEFAMITLLIRVLTVASNVTEVALSMASSGVRKV